MAFTVDDNNTQEDSRDGAYGGSNIGSGSGGALDTDSVYQNTGSWGRKIGTAASIKGFTDSITSRDATTTAFAVLVHKSLLTNPTSVNPSGVEVRIGSSTSNYNGYIVADEGTRPGVVYPPAASWLISPIDVNITAWIDNQPGSAPTLTAISEIGIAGETSAVAKDLNIFGDSLDFAAEGLFGAGLSPAGVWADFLSWDEGTLSRRIGLMTSNEGILLGYGTFTIGRDSGGTAIHTSFIDANQTLVFPGGRVDTGWNGIEADLSHASVTQVQLSTSTFIGRGRDGLKRYFDSELDVNGTTEVFTILGHGFLEGEAVIYNDEGGTTITGLTDLNEYFIGDVTTDTFEVYSGTRQTAFTGGGGVGVTAAGSGNGENHSFTRTPDTRPNLTFTGTSGVWLSTGDSWQRFNTMSLTDALATIWTGDLFVGCTSIDVNGNTFTDCTFTAPQNGPGLSYLTCDGDDVEGVTGCDFTDNADQDLAGHAIEITGSPTSAEVDLSNLSFTNWGKFKKNFNASSDVDTGTDVFTVTTHAFSTGDEVYYSDEGGTTISGLTDQGLYYVRSITGSTLTLHLSKSAAVANSNIVNVTSGSSETHTIYHAHAAIYNNTGAALQINLLNGTTTMSVRNGTGASTTQVVSVDLDIDGVAEHTRIEVFGDGGAEDGVSLLSGDADSTGAVSGTFGGSTPQDVLIQARNAGIVGAYKYTPWLGGDTDETLNARDATGANDVPIWRTSGSVVTNDRILIGNKVQFSKILINISTAGVGTWNVGWGYSTSSGYSFLTDEVSDGDDNDETLAFREAGWKTISFTPPGDWDTRAEDGDTLYWIRAIAQSASSTTTLPAAEMVTLGNTVKYLPIDDQPGTIVGVTGLSVTLAQTEDTINP